MPETEVADGFVVFTDPDTGCKYLGRLVNMGYSITPRLRADGSPDCPKAARAAQ